jgi:hypothetical protein
VDVSLVLMSTSWSGRHCHACGWILGDMVGMQQWYDVAVGIDCPVVDGASARCGHNTLS